MGALETFQVFNFSRKFVRLIRRPIFLERYYERVSRTPQTHKLSELIDRKNPNNSVEAASPYHLIKDHLCTAAQWRSPTRLMQLFLSLYSYIVASPL